MSIRMVCIVYGGRDGFGLAVLNRLSLSTRSPKTCKMVSNSDLLSLATLLDEAAASAERAAGLVVRGDGAGEFALDEAGEAVGVRSLYAAISIPCQQPRIGLLTLASAPAH